MASGSNEGGFIRSAAGPLSGLREMVDAETFERIQRARELPATVRHVDV